MKRFLLTGSEGVIGKIVLSNVLDYDIVSLDRIMSDRSGYIQDNLQDLAELNAKIRPYLPFDCILHLAADSSVQATWESVLHNNIIASYNIFQCARENMIKRIVYASTNHVTGLYEGNPPLLHMTANYDPFINTLMPIRPDSYYAVSKVFGEALGRYYSEIYDIEVACLRLGTVLEDNNPVNNPRHRATWLSHKDLIALIKATMQSSIKFGVYYGVSANTRRFWDISNAYQDLGYAPEDNAECFFAKSTSMDNGR